MTYEWDFSDGFGSTEKNPSHAFAAPGAYRVSLTVSDGADTDVAFATVFMLARPTTGKPSKSSPIAFSSDERQLWMVNPDSDSVTLFRLEASNAVKVTEIAVGKFPRTVAVSLDGTYVFVACQESDQLWVLNAAARTLNRKIAVGHEPYGVAVSPRTGEIWVSNQGDRTVTIIGPDLHIFANAQVGIYPRAIAISADGYAHFVSQFITRWSARIYADNQAAGRLGTFVDLLDNPGPDTPSSGEGTPNLLSALTIDPSGRNVWVGGLKSNSGRGLARSRAALTPENTVRGFFGPISTTTFRDAVELRIDSNNADSVSAIAFSPNGRYAYVTHQGAETLSVYDIPAANLVSRDDGAPVPFVRIDVGNAPQGILISSNGQRAYVANFVSRDLMTIDLSSPTNPVVIARSQPTAEPLSPSVANGKRLFYRSRAPKHSRDNYISCASCHPDGGMDDGQTWDFTQRGEGLRNTIDLRGRGGMAHGPVHWSANFDEIQDFENDIVNEFGGTGLAQDGLPPNPPMGPPNTGRSQDLDNLAAYVNSLTKPPRSPFRRYDGTLTDSARRGKTLFFSSTLRCAQCHAPPAYTDSTLATNSYVLHDVGTLTWGDRRLGEPLTGLDTPSLFGFWQSAPWLHDGRALTQEMILTAENTNGQHGLTSQLTVEQRTDLLAYLNSIDGSLFDEPLDSDGDGMSDPWESRYGLNPADRTDATVDPDNDGLTNLDEFFAWTDPTEYYSSLRIAFERGFANFTIVVPTVRGQAYNIEAKQNIGDEWTNVYTFFGNGADRRYPEPLSANRRFYRVTVPNP